MTAVHVLTAAEAADIRRVLHTLHVDVTLDVDTTGRTHIHPAGPVDTRGEVVALRAVAAVTDSTCWDDGHPHPAVSRPAPIDPDIAARVAAGAQWLDDNVPGWVDLIDLDRLDLRSTCRCVLGQLFDDYDFAPRDARWYSGDYGFDAVGDHLTAEYVALTDAWTRLITTRRQRAALLSPARTTTEVAL